MPNWVGTSWNVNLPTKNVKKFLNYFLRSESEEVDNLKGQYLYRTFMTKDSLNEIKMKDGTSNLAFYSDSAWSLESILIETKDENTGVLRCPDLQTICEKCEVNSLSAVGDEPGMCFRQFIEWDKDDGLSFSAQDLTMWDCDKCCTFGYWEDQDPDADQTVCPVCGCKFYEEE